MHIRTYIHTYRSTSSPRLSAEKRLEQATRIRSPSPNPTLPPHVNFVTHPTHTSAKAPVHAHAHSATHIASATQYVGAGAFAAFSQLCMSHWTMQAKHFQKQAHCAPLPNPKLLQTLNLSKPAINPSCDIKQELPINVDFWSWCCERIIDKPNTSRLLK